MANSFNISVKPEIAAVKVDTADIRTDVTAIHDTNLPAVKTDTADIRTDVTAIHDTDLPAVKSAVDALDLLTIAEVQTTAAIDGTDLICSNDAEATNDTGAYSKTKESLVYFAGEVTVSFDLKAQNDSDTVQAKIYINGVAQGIERSKGDDIYVTFSEVFTLAVDDLLQIYTKNLSGACVPYVRNLRVYGTTTPNCLCQDP